jgi:hypothetical protein
MAFTKTLSKSGKPPVERLDGASMGAALVQQLITDDGPRATKRATVQGLIDGNPPYKQADLKRTGQSYRSNVNFREAEGHVRARKTTYANLLLDVPCLVKMTLRDRQYSTTDYASRIAGRFHELVMKKWTGFMYNMLLHQGELVEKGVGPIYWPHVRDWRFKALKHGSFLVMSGADSTLDTLKIAVIRGSYQPDELFYKFGCTDEEIKGGMDDARKQKMATEAGWNVKLAKKLIMDADLYKGSTADDQYSTSRWESIQQQIKNGDTMYASVGSEDIHVAHIYVKEFRGGVSHYVIAEGRDQDEYLYQKKNEQESFDKLICLFVSDIGDGSYHSIKGMGPQIYAHCVVNNRMKNTMVDAAGLAASMVMQGDLSNARLLRLGPVALIQAGVNVVTGAFNPNLDGILKVSAKLEQNLSHNVGTDRPDLLDHPEDSRPTQAGERGRMYREGRLERTDIMYYYQQADILWTETWRRLTAKDYARTDPGYDEREEFFKACKEDGVPPELLKPDAVTIEASRALGYGSPVMAREIAEGTVSLAAYFPENGKTNAIRDLLAHMHGYRNVDRYMPEINPNGVPSNEHSIATLENNDLQAGEQCLVGQDQSAIIHLLVHLAPLMQIAEQFISTGGVGDNVLKVRDYFLMALHHCAEHLDLMKDDKARAGEYRQFVGQFDELLKVFNKLDALSRKLQDQLRAEQEQQMADMESRAQGDPELAAKLAKQQDDFQLGVMKEQNMDRIRQQKAAQIMNINAAKAAQKLSQ